MADTGFILWLFPTLFILHDFEEILFTKVWMQKRGKQLMQSIPASRKLLKAYDGLHTAAFALGVFEEYLLACLITIAAWASGWFYLWLGAFIAFALHLVIHCAQALAIRQYTPALATSILCLPVSVFLIAQFIIIHALPVLPVVGWAAASFVIMVANLALVHKGMARYNQWLQS